MSLEYSTPHVIYQHKEEYQDVLPEIHFPPGDGFSYHPWINLCDYWDYLYGIQVEALYARRNQLVPPLRRVSVFLTEKCNLSCSYCTCKPSEVQTMDIGWLLDNLEISREMGAVFLDVMGLGEPTMIDELPDVLMKAASLGFVTTLGTNGATPNLKDPAYLEKLFAASPLKIRVSLDSAIPEIHNRQRGEQDTWHQAVEFIKNLVRARERNGLRAGVFVNRVVTADTFETIPRDVSFFADLGVDDVHLIPVRYHTQLFLRPDQIARFNDAVAPRIRELGKGLKMAWLAENAFPFGRGRHEIQQSAKGVYYSPTKADDCYVMKSQIVLDPLRRPYTCLWGKRAGGVPIEDSVSLDENLRQLRARLLDVNYLEVNPGICGECCTREIISVNDQVQRRLEN